MRTTITFDADTAAAVEQLRRRAGVGISAATNEPVRRGSLRPEPVPRFERTRLPWPSLLAFVRIRTTPGVYERPLTADQAWSRVEAWLAAPAAWVRVRQRSGCSDTSRTPIAAPTPWRAPASAAPRRNISSGVPPTTSK